MRKSSLLQELEFRTHHCSLASRQEFPLLAAKEGSYIFLLDLVKFLALASSLFNYCAVMDKGSVRNYGKVKISYARRGDGYVNKEELDYAARPLSYFC
ncbi:hypothetical protein VNO77_14324 [Canavalia gladiata]|uniref:Uncharacterized protein n=1 Tax=Canavalia gladiata TaxID=3824 RepID=A0AAN9QRY9_CANGL